MNYPANPNEKLMVKGATFYVSKNISIINQFFKITGV